MKKLVENLLSWCKKSMKMRRCVGKSTAPVTGQSVGQTGNAEGVLPSTATETVDEIVLPAAVETAGMVETIDEKAAFGKSGRKKPENMLDALQRFLTIRYDFRYNLLTEQTEYRGKEMPDEEYAMVAQRDLNTFCLEARTGGINCWDKDVSRLLHSRKVENYHPFLHYMSHLPQWDGVDRVTPLAVRISRKPMWVKGFHRWMLGVAAQWLGQAQDCANAVAPMLVSREQGKRKSSFCRSIMPPSECSYYTDSLDFSRKKDVELSLNRFALINIDEFDQVSATQQGFLKHILQKPVVNARRPYGTSVVEMRRYASFIATSNHKDLLTDPSGSRRFICIEVKGGIDTSRPIDYDQLYAQAMHELAHGERYWFNDADEYVMTEANREFQQYSPEEQFLFRYFRMAEAGEEGEWMAPAEILKILHQEVDIPLNAKRVAAFGRILRKQGIPSRHTRKGTVYQLVRA